MPMSTASTCPRSPIGSGRFSRLLKWLRGAVDPLRRPPAGGLVSPHSFDQAVGSAYRPDYLIQNSNPCGTKRGGHGSALRASALGEICCVGGPQQDYGPSRYRNLENGGQLKVARRVPGEPTQTGREQKMELWRCATWNVAVACFGLGLALASPAYPLTLKTTTGLSSGINWGGGGPAYFAQVFGNFGAGFVGPLNGPAALKGSATSTSATGPLNGPAGSGAFVQNTVNSAGSLGVFTASNTWTMTVGANR